MNTEPSVSDMLTAFRKMGKRHSKNYRRHRIMLRNHDEKMAAIQAEENARNLEICRQIMPWLRDRGQV